MCSNWKYDKRKNSFILNFLVVSVSMQTIIMQIYSTVTLYVLDFTCMIIILVKIHAADVSSLYLFSLCLRADAAQTCLMPQLVNKQVCFQRGCRPGFSLRQYKRTINYKRLFLILCSVTVMVINVLVIVIFHECYLLRLQIKGFRSSKNNM